MGVCEAMDAVGNHKDAPDSEEVLSLLTETAQNTLRQLDGLMTLGPAYEAVWIHNLSNRIPEASVKAWEAYRTDRFGSRLPTIQEFLLQVQSQRQRSISLSWTSEHE